MEKIRDMEELTLRETQLASLEILKKIHNICEEQGYKYVLFFGTLIGAIRHGGFIPWDDDIDIMMPREDYNKLLCYFEENAENLYPIQIVNSHNEKNCPFMISRVIDDRYQMIPEFGSQYHMGTFIDVYPYDDLGKTEEEAKKLCKLSWKYSSGYTRSIQEDCLKFSIKTYGLVKGALKYATYLCPKILGSKYYKDRLEKLVGEVSSFDTKYVGCIAWYMTWKEVFPSQWLQERELYDFENEKFWIPKSYDMILHHNYGEYKKLPPKKEQIAHHLYKIVKKKENNGNDRGYK